MRILNTTTVSVTTTGTAGTATGSGSSAPITGELLDVYIDYHASCPATADVTISESTFGNILVRSNSATDGRFAPRMPIHDAAAAVITNGWDQYPLNNSVITVSVAQANALTDCVVVTIRWWTTF